MGDAGAKSWSLAEERESIEERFLSSLMAARGQPNVEPGTKRLVVQEHQVGRGECGAGLSPK